MEESSHTTVDIRPYPRVMIKREDNPLMRLLCLDFVEANLTMMKLTFIFSCIGVLLDPLFFYIPIIDETNKCLGVDKSLRTLALVTRTLTDIPLVIYFIVARSYYWPDAIPLHVIDSSNMQPSGGFKRKLKKLVYLLLAIVTVLPIPQVAIVLVFPRIQGSGYLYFLNALLLFQYVLRVYQIHQILRYLQYNLRRGVTAAFNFFLYILAGHVLGALWYFFSIQRETSCWHQACKDVASGCISTYRCHGSSTSSSIKFRNESCPTNLPNATLFDFGIFQDMIQSGNTGLIKFRQNFFYCFWWGVRNISNFGTNLETSSYVWENCFALLISIIGLLLFLYLIGNVQLYLRSKAKQILFAQEVRANKLHRVERKIREWTARNGIPEEMIMTKIMKNVKQKLEEINYADEDENVNLKYVLSNLPWYLRKRVQRRLCMDTLEKVPMLRNMEGKGLKMICEYLRPMIYCQDQIIVQAGKPLDLMFIVIEGTVRCVDAIGNAAPQLQKGYFFGEELFTSESRHPISVQTVICETEVEAFILTTEDLRNLVRTSQFLRNLMEEQL